MALGVEQAAADAIPPGHVRRRPLRVHALQGYRALLLHRPNPATVATGDELHPAALITPTTMRTSVLTIANIELGQPHIVHHPCAAQPASLGECGGAAPLTDDEALAPLLRPLVAAVEHLDGQVAGLDKMIAARAKASAACKRLMTVPGVGPLVALTYAAGVDDPARFSDSRTVGAHFGLTPRRFQSGEMDWSGGVSRAGDAGVRRALYQAANVLIHHSRGWCALKSWAVRVAKRRGLGKAKVALARKLAVVLHKMWMTGEDYRLKATA